MMLSDYYCEKSHKHKQETVILKISHLPYARQQVNCICMLLALPFTEIVERDNRRSFTRCFHLLLLRKSQIDTTELYLYVTLHPFICCYRNEERFPLLLETNNALKIVTQAYFNSEQTIDFCVVKVFMVLLETKKKFLKLTKRPWVRNDYIPNEQRCILLLEMNKVSLCC